MSHLPASPPGPAPEGEPDKTKTGSRDGGPRGPPRLPSGPVRPSARSRHGLGGREPRHAGPLRRPPRGRSSRTSGGSPPDSPARRALEAPPARTRAPARMAAGTSLGRHAGRDGDAGPRRPRGARPGNGRWPGGSRQAPGPGSWPSSISCSPASGRRRISGVRPDRRPGSPGPPGRQVVDRAPPHSGHAARRGTVAAWPGPGADRRASSEARAWREGLDGRTRHHPGRSAGWPGRSAARRLRRGRPRHHSLLSAYENWGRARNLPRVVADLSGRYPWGIGVVRRGERPGLGVAGRHPPLLPGRRAGRHGGRVRRLRTARRPDERVSADSRGVRRSSPSRWPCRWRPGCTA